MFDLKLILETEPQKFSASKIGCFDKCPLQYKLHYIDKIEIPGYEDPDITLEGRAFHSIAEHYKYGDDIIKLAVRCFDENELTFIKDNNAMMKAVLNIKAYKDRLYNRVKSGEILWMKEEQKYECNIEGYVLNGLADLVYEDGNGIHIVDYKTPRTSGDERYIQQLMIYVLLVSKGLGAAINSLDARIFYIRIGEEGKPFRMDERKANLFFADILSKMRKAQNETKFEACPSMFCDWCEYYKTDYCPATKNL